MKFSELKILADELKIRTQLPVGIAVSYNSYRLRKNELRYELFYGFEGGKLKVYEFESAIALKWRLMDILEEEVRKDENQTV